QAVIARDTAVLDQAAAGVVLARQAQVRQSAIGILVANEVKGDGLRVLISVRSAFAFGAGLGFAAALLRLLRRRWLRRRHSGPVTRRTTGRRPSASGEAAATPR